MAEQDPIAEEVTQDTDVDLEDMDVSFDDEADDTEEEAEDVTEADDEESEAATDDEEDEPEDAPVEEQKEEADTSEEDRKAKNREMAQKRLEDKAKKDAELKQQQEQYLSEAETEEQLAFRQLQIDAYTNKVENNTNKLTNGYERAIKDFSILNDQSPAIQKFVADAIDEFQARYVTVDDNGNPTEVRADFYQHLQAKADSIAELTGMGARQQEKSKTKEKSKAMVTPTRAPKQSKSDPIVDGFDEEVASW